MKIINIDKVIREIKESSLYVYSNTKVIYEKMVIKIIKDNIRINNIDIHKYHDLLDKYSKLVKKYIKMGDEYNNLLKELNRPCIKP